MAHIAIDLKMRVPLFSNDPIDQGAKTVVANMETRLAAKGLMAKLTAMSSGCEPYLDLDVHLES